MDLISNYHLELFYVFDPGNYTEIGDINPLPDSSVVRPDSYSKSFMSASDRSSWKARYMRACRIMNDNSVIGWKGARCAEAGVKSPAGGSRFEGYPTLIVHP
jgi:hypothetical protein